MPSKLSYDFVKEYINKEEFLVSTDYKNNKELLEIKCKICNNIYLQTFDRYRRGHRHNLCKSINLPSRRATYKTCVQCEKEFKAKHSIQKLCDINCKQIFDKSEIRRQQAIIYGSIGGKISATCQQKRSKNEIYMAELCISHFGNDNIDTNSPIFNGWDADIIIHSHKIAILWNGIWHYKKIIRQQSLEQIQNRDRIKNIEIIKYGYEPYIIKDMGKHNKKFVDKQFNDLLLYLSMRSLSFDDPDGNQTDNLCV